MTPSETAPTRIDDTDALVLQSVDARGVCTLTLNRPRQYNALSDAVLDELDAALLASGENPEVRCVVIAANGPAFCAGHDLRELRASEDRRVHEATFARCSGLMQRIVAHPVPVIARVQGLATAAGCQLVASCDLAVAAERAQFAVSGIRAGLFCSTPAVALSRAIAPKRAFEMLVTGDLIAAVTARDWGLVNAVVTDAALDEGVARYTDSICAKSRHAIRRGKALFHRQIERPLAEAYADASEAITCDLSSHDAREGIDAFLEKRAPHWRDR